MGSEGIAFFDRHNFVTVKTKIKKRPLEIKKIEIFPRLFNMLVITPSIYFFGLGFND